MSSIKETIDKLISNSADAISLNSFIKTGEGDVAADASQTHVKKRKRSKKGDPKKEFKIMIDRFIMNLNADTDDDLDDFITFMNCYTDDEFDKEHYFNSTFVLIMRKLIAFDYYIDKDDIINLFKYVTANDRIKANTIDVYIDYLEHNCKTMKMDDMNMSITIIHSNIIGNNLWISEVNYLKLIELVQNFILMDFHKGNLIITTILTCIDAIIKRYPYFEKPEIKKEIDSLVRNCFENDLVGLSCDYDSMSANLVSLVYHNVITKVHKDYDIDELGRYKSFVDQFGIGKNLIIDGKNIFHDTSASDKKYINFKGLSKFIEVEKEKKYSERTYNKIYVVFYCEHYKVLKAQLKDLIESSDYNSIKFCDHVYIVLSPVKQNDDVLTLHLWLSRAGNYIMTKDNFTDHAKTFHSNTYLYEIWCYYYSNMLVNMY